MTRSKKIWLGILTFLPIFCMMLYFVFFFFFFFGIYTSEKTGNTSEVSPVFFANFGLMFLFIILAVISGLAMMIYYIIHANSNPKFDSNQKLMWILILVLASGIGSIVYFFVEIVPKKTTAITS